MIAIATLTGTEKEMSEDAVLAGNDIVINANKLLDIPARGFICVADVDRDLKFGCRKNCVRMEDGSTHVGEGAQLSVTHIGDSFRVLDDPGIRGIQP